jgi:hypothetical protein
MMLAILPLALSAAAPQTASDRRIPVPTENGSQPPMTFACRLSGPTGQVALNGRISRFYLKVAPGVGLLVVAEPGGYRDHVVLEIEPSALPGLAGRYDTEARFPDGTDKMVLTLPGAGGSGGYVLTASPVRFGVGYQAFTNLRVERGDSPAAAWSGSCTTMLPKPDHKP